MYFQSIFRQSIFSNNNNNYVDLKINQKFYNLISSKSEFKKLKILDQHNIMQSEKKGSLDESKIVINH